jgi:hypothetical protein
MFSLNVPALLTTLIRASPQTLRAAMPNAPASINIAFAFYP